MFVQRLILPSYNISGMLHTTPCVPVTRQRGERGGKTFVYGRISSAV